MPRTSQTNHKWTDEENAWMTKYYRHFGYNLVTDAFNRHFNLNLSQASVTSHAREMNLQGQDDPTKYTLAEVAGMLNCCHTTLRNRIKRGTVKAVKVLGDWLIDGDELDKLTEYRRTDTPWPAIRACDAAKRLSYTTAALNFLIHRGSVSAVKRGKYWMVKLSEIEAAEQYMKRTGHVRVPWAKLKQQAEKDIKR